MNLVVNYAFVLRLGLVLYLYGSTEYFFIYVYQTVKYRIPGSLIGVIAQVAMIFLFVVYCFHAVDNEPFVTV